MAKYCVRGCLLLLLVQLQYASAQAPPAQPAGIKRALLIGINNYKSVPGLQGSINDVETMREVLITRWGFESRNIQTLTDANATRAALLAALNSLVQAAGPADTVYVHYSGHGSQVQDLNGDEPDGLDETIVPQDGRSPGIRDIVDDELDAIFAKLRARSVVIVLDSCHSGTATRAMAIRTRSIPADNRLELYRENGAAVSTRAIVPFRKSRFVVMGGAAANEEALDGEVDGRYHGFFTYALSRSLANGGGAASPRQVFAGVARELGRIQANYGRSSMPEPQLEAPPEALDSPLFSALVAPNTPGVANNSAVLATPPQSPRLAWVAANPIAANQVLLVNATSLGAAPGSTWAIYPRGETRFAPAAASAVARVTDLTGKDARATITSQTAPLQPDSRAVIFLPPPASSRVPIRILDVPAEQRTHIADVLRRNIRDLVLVGPTEPARFLVDTQGAAVRLLTADGLRVLGTFAANDERGAANVARIASRSAGATELLSLDNPMSQLQIGLHVTDAGTPSSRDIVKVESTAAAQLHARRDGEPRSAQNSLQLQISVSADAYLTIVDVDSEGNMNVLFPNDYQKADFYPNGAVRAGSPILIPDSLQSGNRAGFHWDYSPPKGTDTVRVFASTDLATANRIRERIRVLQSGAGQSGGSLGTRAIGDVFAGLRADLAGTATRGIKVTADTAPADWTAASVTIDVMD